MRRTGCLVAMFCLLTSALPSTVAAQQVAWEQWQHQVGIVEVGTRSDGTLVAMVAGHLVLLSSSTGAATPFSTANDGFSADPNAEAYFVVAQPLGVAGAACSFDADDVFILDLTSPPGLARVDSAGHSTRFTTFAGVDTLGGITQDIVGTFGNRLLVTGTHNGNQTTVFAVDCQGSSTVVTDSAPQVEGGIAVAPTTFGQLAGDLIASDENSDQVWAIDPSGNATLAIQPGLASGGDTGVESEGFVPPGFVSSGGGFAYLSDRGTPDNPFPGTDSILRLSASALAAAGVQDGDLLDAVEGGGTTVAIRCAQTCAVVATIQGTVTGHIEGHIAFRQAP